MKKIIILIVLLLVAMSVYGQSRGLITLDDAIFNAALQIQDGLRNGSRIIVYQFQSQNSRLSEYVLRELFDILVNFRSFTVLDRTSQEVINDELNYQYNTSAGMISDESLADITRRLGAQAIITGSLDDTGDEYRFRIRVIGTETTAADVSYVGRISKNDRRITAFLGREAGFTDNLGTGALNILLGLGSYIQGDISGGLTITAGYALSAGLFIVEAAFLDWDSQFVGVPATIGVATLGITLVYGFVRPFIYTRTPRLAHVIDNFKPEIVMSPNNRDLGLQITYTINY